MIAAAFACKTQPAYPECQNCHTCGMHEDQGAQKVTSGGVKGCSNCLTLHACSALSTFVSLIFAGHPAWPCLVMNEDQAERVKLEPGPKETTSTTSPVQYFGTYEVGR